MNTNKILLIAGAALVVLVAVWLMYKKGDGSERFGNMQAKGFLPLCSASPPAAPSAGSYYSYMSLNPNVPCSISDVCSNGALCASNDNDQTPYCTNNSNKTCDSSLDWYANCVGQLESYPPIDFSSGCDKNGENCRPKCS
jgi:hypothetical protein